MDGEEARTEQNQRCTGRDDVADRLQDPRTQEVQSQTVGNSTLLGEQRVAEDAHRNNQLFKAVAMRACNTLPECREFAAVVGERIDWVPFEHREEARAQHEEDEDHGPGDEPEHGSGRCCHCASPVTGYRGGALALASLRVAEPSGAQAIYLASIAVRVIIGPFGPFLSITE